VGAVGSAARIACVEDLPWAMKQVVMSWEMYLFEEVLLWVR